MLCDLSMQCPFYLKHKQSTYLKVNALLVDSYCHGAMQVACKRKLFEQEQGITPPDGLSPTGHQVRGIKSPHTA